MPIAEAGASRPGRGRAPADLESAVAAQRRVEYAVITLLDGGAMTVAVRLLGAGDADVLGSVADGVFDHAIAPRWAAEFLADTRHHLVVAIDAGSVVGMVSAVHYVHPDKPPQLFINEVGVAPSHHRRGIGRAMLDEMLEHGRALGCTEAWVGTEEKNDAANGLYRAAGGVPEPFVLYSFPLLRRTSA